MPIRITLLLSKSFVRTPSLRATLLLTNFMSFSVEWQRYEAASTLFGPHTLAAYQQEYSSLATSLIKGLPVPPGPTPPDLSGSTVCIPLFLSGFLC